ncbi:unnamed protein product, partial [Ectocarpus fasciculatus]
MVAPVRPPRVLSVPTSLASIVAPTAVAAGTSAAAAAAPAAVVVVDRPEAAAVVGEEEEERRASAVLRIVDARPMISAKGHLILGKGHEVISRLGGPRRASLTFLEIPNVHAMQQSFATLMSACSGREGDPAWLVNLH